MLCCSVGERLCTLGTLLCTVGELFCAVEEPVCAVGELFCPEEDAVVVAVSGPRVGKDPLQWKQCFGGCRTPRRFVLEPLGCLFCIGGKFSRSLWVLLVVLSCELCATSPPDVCF